LFGVASPTSSIAEKEDYPSIPDIADRVLKIMAEYGLTKTECDR